MPHRTATATQSKRGQCRQCHAFLPGHEITIKHGLRRRVRERLPEDLRQSVEDLRAQVVADQGGRDDLSAIRAGLVRLLVGSETLFRVAYAELHRQGRHRHASGQAGIRPLLTATHTWQCVAERLGIDRRPKDATQDIRDVVGEALAARHG